METKTKHHKLIENIEQALKRHKKDMFKFNIAQLLDNFKHEELKRN